MLQTRLGLRFLPVSLIFLTLISANARGQTPGFPPFTNWYQNPLGFKPLELHTSNGILIPALATGLILLVTRNDSSAKEGVTLYNEFGASRTYFSTPTVMYQNNTGLLFPLRRYLYGGLELTSYYAHDTVNKTPGFGIRPFVRFYPVHGKRFKLYFESGAGLIYFLNEFPARSNFFGDTRTGTHLNGSPKYGIGTEVRLGRSWWFNAGIRHVHISNGNTVGASRNPGHDSNGGFIGLMFRPGR